MSINITSEDIKKLLSKKHGDDVFVTECKLGPSWGGTQRIDAWVMPKSWAHMNTIAYEIKVSRSDFLNDNKWRTYLDFCHSFYFVCPTNLISAEELPEEAGLMWVSPSGKKLYTKKKAPLRDTVIPSTLFYYLLMWRTKLHDKERAEYSTDGKKKILKEYVKDKKWNQAWGHSFGKRLSKVISDELDKVKSENNKLLEAVEGYKNIEKFLKENNMYNADFYSGFNFEDRIKRDVERLQKPFDGKLDYVLNSAIKDLTKIKNIIEGKDIN